MTNYNERLDEILLHAVNQTHDRSLNINLSATASHNIRAVLVNEAKQAITSLIKELVAEAKPEYRYCGFHGGKDSMVDCSACNPENMVDVYRKSLLKALEEVI